MINLDFKRYNSFNLSHEYKTTCDMGVLVPVLCKEVIPGDIWRCHANMFMRLIPQLAPFMHKVMASIQFFYEPCRFVKDNFEEFITKGFQGTSVIPWSYIEAPAVTGFQKYSIPDYMGLPVGVPGIQVDAMPIRGFWHIYNEWYLNELLQSYVSYPTTDGQDTTTPLTVPYRCYPSDYFCGAKPQSQLGNPVYLPLGTEAPVVFNDGMKSYNDNDISNRGVRLGIYTPGGTYAASSMLADAKSGESGNDLIPVNSAGDPSTAFKVDLNSATSATINDIRVAFQVQKWMERNMQGGVRWVEYLWSHFHERTSDLRLQRPEYLGAGKSVIVTSEVLQTSSTDSTSPQGNMAGHSFSGQTTMSFTRRFEEFGYVYAILSVMPQTQYQQGIERMWSRKTSLDYYDPLFSHLGMQEIKNKELYAQGTSADEGVFGFTDRYDELRKAYSKVTGDFRDTLDYWTMTRKFNSLPQLNANFVTASDVTKRIFTVTNAKPCLVDIGFRINVLRKLPKHGTPGALDHG